MWETSRLASHDGPNPATMMTECPHRPDKVSTPALAFRNLSYRSVGYASHDRRSLLGGDGCRNSAKSFCSSLSFSLFTHCYSEPELVVTLRLEGCLGFGALLESVSDLFPSVNAGCPMRETFLTLFWWM